MSTEVQHRSPRLGTTYRPRIKGAERAAVARSLGQDYNAGSTIRRLAEERGMSYGTVRALLLEAKVTLRGRGGRVARG
ncbi:helix-turn-helix domain-containing protein [Streptomyces griseoincarnatus]